MKLHANAPFALVGINAWDSPADFRQGVEDYGVTWPVAYQGEDAAPICEQYRVVSYPSIFVLDAEGRIVATDLRGEALDAKVAELLKALEHAGE